MSSGTAAQERDKELSLVQHLGELRDRLVVTAIALVATTAIAFFFATQLIRILIIPVDCTFIPTYTCHTPPTTLISLSPTENFATYFRVALFAGLALAMPVILYEIYAYVDPALLPKERRFIRFMGLPVIGLFVAGMLFCYFVLLPNAIKFLINFGDEVIKNQLRAADYISFVTIFILDKTGKIVRRTWTFGVDAGYSLEVGGILLQDIRQVAVVPSVMDHLDDHRVGYALRLHQLEQHLGRGILFRHVGALRERKLRIMLPHMNMRIDDFVAWRSGKHARCQSS